MQAVLGLIVSFIVCWSFLWMERPTFVAIMAFVSAMKRTVFSLGLLPDSTFSFALKGLKLVGLIMFFEPALFKATVLTARLKALGSLDNFRFLNEPLAVEIRGDVSFLFELRPELLRHHPFDYLKEFFLRELV